ncbi:hydroxymethylpyrimidine/phosphomethylpyrimidine kinase [Chryseobacterium gambrini]|uniref:hydroxymethylpyrimidine kinase n=1 Tax=Chryseobacterium gambrini TaxID=373672 RepID=A0AAJ1VM52_9FLAO|nr:MULTISPECIES: hydroxymethylpyrimidine/phosphomethylpyrimidine kinase [Chryseobacterium]MDN4014866.1 hydroxymethylpyrimidine/phosphomethylpyrimidine kinase [Chryseobacterium gambrini]MDN4030895.1 hydroxymethylpyrimidine/phosphomethylpyrimidine kinase [Chryseobacterium gambrini]QWA36749.1 hydroxymethylpyrimidine/phosphomethylpyrimidine kinase [Chryseobacterium sp. ZHDP1]
MQKERPFVMSIAGFDPSGGAGVLADIKTFEQLKVQGLAVCTAMTLQTESEFYTLQWQPIDEIVSAIGVLMKKYKVEAVKIGVVKDAEFLAQIVKKLKSINPEVKIVWDPVLKSTSEFSFFDLNTISDVKNVLDQIDLITPNYYEYNVLKEHRLFQPSENGCSVLIKGGHREDKIGTDILIQNGKEIFIELSETFSVFYPKHGSGCVLSSAIVSHLANGENLQNACRKGKLYIEKFLASNPTLLGFHS